MNIKVIPIKAGKKVTGTIMINSDITEKRKAALETKELKDYLQLQINRMPLGLIVWNKEFRVKTWNPAAEKIFGFTEKEAVGKHPYDLIVPKKVQPIVDDIWGRLLKGDKTAHSTNDNITKSGLTITCSWANTPLKKADGTVIGVLSMVQDITEKKEAEETLKKRTEELEKFNRLAVGRELKMIELKKEIARLKGEEG
jgi:PAS domain S-box-containing protein